MCHDVKSLDDSVMQNLAHQREMVAALARKEVEMSKAFEVRGCGGVGGAVVGGAVRQGCGRGGRQAAFQRGVAMGCEGPDSPKRCCLTYVWTP